MSGGACVSEVVRKVADFREGPDDRKVLTIEQLGSGALRFWCGRTCHVVVCPIDDVMDYLWNGSSAPQPQPKKDDPR